MNETIAIAVRIGVRDATRLGALAASLLVMLVGCGDDGAASGGTDTTGAGGGGEGTSLVCSEDDFPGPEVPVQCHRCVVAEGETMGFCADGVLSPTCVDGTWQCTGDEIAAPGCEVAGSDCSLP